MKGIKDWHKMDALWRCPSEEEIWHIFTRYFNEIGFECPKDFKQLARKLSNKKLSFKEIKNAISGRVGDSKSEVFENKKVVQELIDVLIKHSKAQSKICCAIL